MSCHCQLKGNPFSAVVSRNSITAEIAEAKQAKIEQAKKDVPRLEKELAVAKVKKAEIDAKLKASKKRLADLDAF